MSRLPPAHKILPAMLEGPVQEAIPIAKTALTYDGVPSELTRDSGYDIHGVVLAKSGPPGGGPLAMFKEPFPNVRDLCLVWGETVKGGGYHAISARNTPDMCWIDYGPDSPPISKSDIGNNHLLALDPAVRRTIERVEVGDQLHLKGSLVEFKAAPWNEGARRSSQSRTDFGEGSGEVMLVDAAEILASENHLLRIGHNILFFVFPLFFAVEVYLARDYGPIKRVK